MTCKNFLRIFLAFILFSLPYLASAAKNDSLQILWIGNSYTYYNDLPAMTRAIAASAGFKLQPTKITKGGERLSGHLKNPKVLKALKKGGWDYVVLQEQSTDPAQATRDVLRTTFPPAHTLDSLAKAGSSNAKVIFYMTWGHKNGNAKKDTPYPMDNNYGDMQMRLKTTYLELAFENHSWCSPVGMAWQRVRHERPDLELYQPDHSHPSLTGSYLAACVFFTTIYQKPFHASYHSDLDSDTAEYLQKVAQKTVLQNLQILGIE